MSGWTSDRLRAVCTGINYATLMQGVMQLAHAQAAALILQHSGAM